MLENLRSDRDKFVVTIQLMDMQVTHARVKLRLKMSGFSRGMQTPINARTPIYELTPGIPLRLTNRDLEIYFSQNNLEFTNIDPNQYRNNTTVPEDRYRIWFEVYEASTGAYVSRNEGFANMHIVQHDVPLINQPQQGVTAYLENLQRVIFQWAPRHFGAGMMTEYKLQIVEIPPNSSASPEQFMAATLVPFFETTTRATTFVYDFSAPELKLGYTYAYHIQAYQVGMDEQLSMFKNNGFTPTQWFRFSQKCPPIRNISIEHVNHGTVKIHYMDHPLYERVEFTRRLDQPDALWYPNRNERNQNPILETNLRAEQTYQYQLKAFCAVEESEYSRMQTFTTQSAPAPKYECGAIDTTPPFTNRIALGQPLKRGDVIALPQRGRLKIEESSGSGPYKGRGTMFHNFVNAHLIVTFEDLEVNELYQWMDGEVISKYNPKSRFMLNMDDFIEGGTDAGNIVSGDVATGHQTTNTLSENDNVEYDRSTGQVVIRGEDGTRTEFTATSGMPTTIADKNGTIFEINQAGQITEIGQKPSTGTAHAGADLQSVPPSTPSPNLARQTATVTFLPHPEQKYAFDQWNPVYQKSLLIAPKYDILNDNYYVPFKNIPPGNSDKIIAQIDINDRSIEIDSIVFQTSKGVIFKPQKREGNRFELTLASGKENDGQELFAMYKQGENWLTLGKLRIQTYSRKTQKVVLVPVNNATIDTATIARQLNQIYEKIGITWQVEKAENFEYENVPDFFERNSRLLSAYTQTMKQFQNEYFDILGDEFDSKAAYLFIFDQTDTDRNQSGFMPRGEQIGYIFSRGMTVQELGTVIAHELGHGVFQLKHTFDGYGLSENELPNNLMDYSQGTHLAKWQWDLIWAPGIVMRIFERDGDAMNLVRIAENRRIIIEVLGAIRDANVSNIKEMKIFGKSGAYYRANNVLLDDGKTYKELVVEIEELGYTVIDPSQKRNYSSPNGNYAGFQFWSNDGKRIVRVGTNPERLSDLEDYLFNFDRGKWESLVVRRMYENAPFHGDRIYTDRSNPNIVSFQTLTVTDRKALQLSANALLLTVARGGVYAFRGVQLVSILENLYAGDFGIVGGKIFAELLQQSPELLQTANIAINARTGRFLKFTGTSVSNMLSAISIYEIITSPENYQERLERLVFQHLKNQFECRTPISRPRSGLFQCFRSDCAECDLAFLKKYANITFSLFKQLYELNSDADYSRAERHLENNIREIDQLIRFYISKL